MRTGGQQAIPADDAAPLDAGRFSPWLQVARRAVADQGSSDVPCGGCTACCTSSQFIHIGPDETDTLASIPEELLVAAPRLPRGHVLLGYDDHGRCPMLVDGSCSIYEHRPRTCRSYDCRVFAASGLELEDPRKSSINRQVRRWRFGLTERTDQVEFAAVRTATALLGQLEPDTDATERTLTAIGIHDLFLVSGPGPGALAAVVPEPEAVRVELTRRRGR